MHPRGGDNGRIADPRRLHPALRRHRGVQAARRWRGDHRQDQPRRVRHGLVDRELGLWDHVQPMGPEPGSWRLIWGLRRGRRRGIGSPRARLRHGRVDPPTCLVVRCGRDEAHLRHREPVRADRIRVVARPDRPFHPHRGGLRPDPVLDLGIRPSRLDVSSGPVPGSDRRPRPGRGGDPRRSGVGALRRGLRAGSGSGHRGHRVEARERGGGGDRSLASHLRHRPVRLLPDRPGRGLFQPGRGSMGSVMG